MGDSGDEFCNGLRILLVEDEAIVAMLTESMLFDMGCADVAVAGSVPEALAVLDAVHFDAAVLDVNLRGKMALPVAERLADLSIPFAFATGYGASDILAAWRDRPLVQKPFGIPELEQALKQALGRG